MRCWIVGVEDKESQHFVVTENSGFWDRQCVRDTQSRYIKLKEDVGENILEEIKIELEIRKFRFSRMYV